MVNINTMLLAVIGSLATVSATDFDKGNVYWHNCGNCKCNAVGQREGFTGSTGCVQIDESMRALGLTANRADIPRKMTTCSVFSDSNCQNEFQSVGVQPGLKYACTAFNRDARSIKCYYDAKK
ncbi:hypothetical protein BGZ63DRAFT_426962 [Mariannaea sp. PMI_226]|nr:hypothetical protein BGZ63DRAFT_426962 [Mariannaea sp. PMI_226]